MGLELVMYFSAKENNPALRVVCLIDSDVGIVAGHSTPCQ